MVFYKYRTSKSITHFESSTQPYPYLRCNESFSLNRIPWRVSSLITHRTQISVNYEVWHVGSLALW